MLPRSALPFVAIITLVVGLVACGSEDPSEINVGCRLNSDCPVGQGCDEGSCVSVEVCVDEGCSCAEDIDCSGALICENDTCSEPTCTTDLNCDVGDVCFGGRCVTDTDADGDRDGVPDNEDLCPRVANPQQEDLDGDGTGDVCDEDIDGDQVVNPEDNCPRNPSSNRNDADGDGLGDVCDPDIDGDGLDNDSDNCRLTANETQNDSDQDGIGDACDLDLDQDGIIDEADNCPDDFNTGQEDLDEDGVGDLCDPDIDEDGVSNAEDNCPRTPNPQQEDRDEDGEGNACEGDADFDGNPDDLDNCPDIANTDQNDLDADNLGDTCDPDDDGDGIEDGIDNCPRSPNEGQEDDDNNGVGDVCEGDRDTDGVPDHRDNCLTDSNPDQADLDLDALGDVCDPDDDGDRVPDDEDNCPVSFNPDQFDADGDGQGNACDGDWRGTTVRGRLVTDDVDDPPFNTAEVRLSGVETLQRADDEGRFVFEEALQNSGTFAIELTWPTFRDKTVTFVSNPGLEEVNLGDIDMDHESDVDPVRLEGVVKLGDRDADAPVHAGINVTVRSTDQRLFATLSTNEEGQFTVPAARTGYLLTLSKEGYDPLTSINAVWDEELEVFSLNGGLPLVLSADLSASVSGRLSSPLEGVQWPTDARTTLVGPARRLIPVNNEGEFLSDNLPPGDYVLEVNVSGHRPVVREVGLDGDGTDLETIILEPLEVLLTAQVALQDEGNPENIIVRARFNNRLVATTLTDNSGLFVLPVSPQTHELSFTRDFYVEGEATVVWVDDHFEKDGVSLDQLGEPIAVLAREPLADQDFDGVPDSVDNCLGVSNPSQDDVDEDGIGDACDNCIGVCLIGDETRGNEFTEGNQSSPVGAGLPNEAFVLVWQGEAQDGDGIGIIARIFSGDGAPLSDEFIVNTTTEGPQTAPTVSALNSGGFVVAWQNHSDIQPRRIDVHARIYNADGSPLGEEIVVNSQTDGDQTGAQVVSLDDGFVVVWGELQGDHSISAQVFHADGVKNGDQLQVTNDGDPEIINVNAAVSALPSNRFVSVWRRTVLGSPEISDIWGRIYNADGNPEGAEFAVGILPGEDSDPDVVAFGVQGFVVVWQGPDSNTQGVVARLFQNDGTPTGEQFIVNQGEANRQSAVSVAPHYTAGFIVSWTSPGQFEGQNTTEDVFLRVFDPLGLPTSDDVLVNTTLFQAQKDSHVSVLSGQYVVSWEGTGQNGGDVFFQLFQ